MPWSLAGPTLSRVGDEEFADYVASRLAGLPGVLAVSLGGSRASGASRPDSDWDFAVYYRGRFDPGDLGALGWPGEVSAIGGWGGGVFNGGAWLRVEGRPVDVHYRDLDDVEHQIAEAREGRFRIERLMFHLAGIPTYVVVAELALHRVPTRRHCSTRRDFGPSTRLFPGWRPIRSSSPGPLTRRSGSWACHLRRTVGEERLPAPAAGPAYPPNRRPRGRGRRPARSADLGERGGVVGRELLEGAGGAAEE